MDSTLSRFQRWAKRLVSGDPVRETGTITIETHQTVVIRRSECCRFWCAECGCDTEMVSLEKAGLLTGSDPGALPRHPAAASWHICPDDNGALFVCLDSVLRSL